MLDSLFRRFLVFSLSSCVVACGGSGGGSDSGTGPVSPPPVANNTKVGGFWNATVITDGGLGSSRQIYAFITEDGQGYLEFSDPTNDYLFDGVITGISGTNGNVVIEFNAHSFGLDFVFADGSTSTSGSIEGTVNERDTFSGSWTLATGESDSFSWIYQTEEHWYEYEIGSSLEQISGIWRDQNTIPAISNGSINPDGSFFFQDTEGCVKSGNISIIDPVYNAYDVSMTIDAGCRHDVPGDYEGFAVLYDTFIDGEYRFDRLQLFMHGATDSSLRWGSTTYERL